MKSGHELAGVGTTKRFGEGAIEAGRGVESGGAVPGLELVLTSRSEIEEEEEGVAGLVVEAGWRQSFTGATQLATL